MLRIVQLWLYVPNLHLMFVYVPFVHLSLSFSVVVPTGAAETGDPVFVLVGQVFLAFPFSAEQQKALLSSSERPDLIIRPVAIHKRWLMFR